MGCLVDRIADEAVNIDTFLIVAAVSCRTSATSATSRCHRGRGRRGVTGSDRRSNRLCQTADGKKQRRYQSFLHRVSSKLNVVNQNPKIFIGEHGFQVRPVLLMVI